jgi:hypothetical protein
MLQLCLDFRVLGDCILLLPVDEAHQELFLVEVHLVFTDDVPDDPQDSVFPVFVPTVRAVVQSFDIFFVLGGRVIVDFRVVFGGGILLDSLEGNGATLLDCGVNGLHGRVGGIDGVFRFRGTLVLGIVTVRNVSHFDKSLKYSNALTQYSTA